MLRFFEKMDRPIDRMMMRFIEEWARSTKKHLKHCQRIIERNSYMQREKRMRVIEAELAVLRDVMWQLQIYQLQARVAQTVERRFRKPEVAGSIPATSSRLPSRSQT